MKPAKPIHVGILSTCSKPADVDGNLDQIASFARQASADGVDILLTPEMSATGYGPYEDVLALAEIAGQGPIFRRLAEIAKETNVVITAGFVEQGPQPAIRYLSHYVVWPDGQFIAQRKNRATLAEKPLCPGVELIPPDYVNAPPLDPADPGQPKVPHFEYFHVKGVKCAIIICFDGGITDVHEIFARENVELVLGPAGAGGRREHRFTTEDLYTEEGRRGYQKLLEQVFFPGNRIAACIKNRHAFAAVNMCGHDGRKQWHVGHGMIVTAMGEVPALLHGLPNLDRQRPTYAHAIVDVAETLEAR